MKHTTRFLILLSLSFLVFKIQLLGHGFGPNTYVKVCDLIQVYDYEKSKWIDQKIEGLRTIEQIYNSSIENSLKVKCYNQDSFNSTHANLNVAGSSETNCYLKIGFDEDFKNFIECTPTQEFYLIESKMWVPAYKLQAGALLFCDDFVGKEIVKIEFIKKTYKVYMLEIDKTHTFLVGSDSVLTHNIPLPVGLLLTLGTSFGQGAVAGGSAGSFFGPLTIGAGIVVGGVIGITAAYISTDRKKAEYRIEFDVNGFEEYIKANSALSNFTEKNTEKSKDKSKTEEEIKESQKQKDKEREKSGAQAPGIPTKEDGFVPPKNWDGKKVKHPKTGQIGYPDVKKAVWVPTGHGALAHRGPHWDVVDKGGRHKNVLPKYN